jgi:3-hydroxy-9,10-secoandrosta-1,3,5(10)-triene-9,17-dione monooxygenase
VSDLFISAAATGDSGVPSVVDEAQRLVPLLREHAAEADRAGELSEAVVKAMREAGLLTLGVPAATGGAEASLGTVFEVYRNLAHGCGSSAWVAMILSGSSLVASALGDEAREELWGADPLACTCSCLPIGGGARESQGGVRVTGRWFPASGVHHAQWAVVAAGRDEAEPVLAVVPVEAGIIERTWATTGMRATRSDSLVLDDVFVPERRVLPFATLMTGGRVPDRPDLTPTLPFLPAALVALAAPLLGMAEFAVERATEWLREQPSGGESARATSPAVLHALADASSRVDAARIVLGSLLAATESIAAAGETPDALFRGRVRMLVARAAADIRDAVRGSLTVFGSHAFATSNPVERVFRDVETASTHAMVSMGRALDEYSPLLLQPGAAPAR